MGFSSFLTSDTQESIAIEGSGHPNEGETVYMLQPMGLPPIEEKNYQGHSVFGEISCYEWIARMNFSSDELRHFGVDKIFDAGLALSMGDFYEDRNDGMRYSYHYAGIHPSILPFEGRFSDPMDKYNGQSPNELIASNKWITKPIRTLFDFKYPLKFSFNRDAIYENLPEAKSCSHQGWFYPHLDDDLYDDMWEHHSPDPV